MNNRLENYCSQTNVEYPENNNIKKEHLGKKELHLNKRGTALFLGIIHENFYNLISELLNL